MPILVLERRCEHGRDRPQRDANWLIQKQKPEGNWQDWGYISNDVEWTGFISENLASEYPYLNETMKGAVNASLGESCSLAAGPRLHE